MNGGYTTGNWPESWIKYWLSRGDIQNLKATILFPAQNNQQFQQDQKAKWIIHYEGTVYFILPVSWNEEGYLDTSKAGTKPLFSQYGASGDWVRWYVVTPKPTLGVQYGNYDDIIIKKADKYDIPRDLLKSLIHQEALGKYDKQLGQYLFQAHSYRYEAHIDYKWYSRQSPTVSPYVGWRGLANHPEHHFTIKGHVVTGESISPGDQVPSDYCYWSEMTSGGMLHFPTSTGCSNATANVTAVDLVALNPKQKWTAKPNWDFTAQLVLASSYGLCQTMYETAIVRGFDTRTENGKPARPVKDLFDPEVSVELGASYLKKMYGIYEDWWSALKYYNGGYVDPNNKNFDSEDYADAIIKTWNNGNGIYKEINE